MRVYARVQELLSHSEILLQPLSDPLRNDFGLHRWLSNEHEEAYSDWLAWVLEQLEGTEVLRVFPVEEVEVGDYCKTAQFVVSREVCIPQGRLDILIKFGSDALLVVEVKKTAAEAAATAKQRGYGEWLKNQKERYKPRPLLLVLDAEEDEYQGFQPILWQDVALELRRMLPSIRDRIGVTKAAMILAFIGAVECNLLGLVPPEADSSRRSVLLHRTLAYLKSTEPELGARS